MANLTWSGCSWAAAVEANGMSPREALATGIAKLQFWHVLPPVLYFYGFIDAYSTLEPLQRGFGCGVAVREAVYLLSILMCAWINPACLLVDIGASVRDGSEPRYSGLTSLAIYVLAPERFAVIALMEKGGLDRDDLMTLAFLLVLPLLDFCGLGALGAGLGAGNLQPALAVGYSVTTFGALLMLALMSCSGDKCCSRSSFIGPGGFCLCCCVLPSLCVPFALALSAVDGSGSF